MSVETKIEVGQRWESKDPRDRGRVVTVVEVSTGFVWVKWVRRSRLRTENLRRLYRLVSS